MSDVPAQQPAQWRISHADREHAAARLRGALDEGRITLDEFDERQSRVLAARTYADLAPNLADLPGPAVAAEIPEYLELRTTFSTLRRKGPWIVPRRLRVTSAAGSVRLDFTEAVTAHPETAVELAVYAASTVLILPPGATADVNAVELIAGSGRVRVPTIRADGPHYLISGRQVAGSLVIRPPRHLLRRR